VNGSVEVEALALLSTVVWTLASSDSIVVAIEARWAVFVELMEAGSAIARADFEMSESDFACCGVLGSGCSVVAGSPETRTNSLFSEADLAKSTGRTFGAVAGGAVCAAGCGVGRA